jgi:tripartite-type tricarboxylate transporter receptor subunit TctC
MKKAMHLLAAALGLATSTFAAAAADWPSRPVRVIVPFAAGGAADVIGRAFTGVLSATFKQHFFVENRAGGGTILGTESVARSEPDGYTLGVSGMPSLVLAPVLNKSASFDPMRDFTHIAYFGGTPIAIVVHPSLNARTFRELSLLAENQAVEYVSPGFGSVGNVVAEALAAKAGLKLQHVPYKGGGSAILDLVAGHVKVGSMTWATTLEHVRSGTLIPIAITTAQRLQEFPNLPTLAELGHPDLVLTSWFSLSGPARLPTHIVDALNRAVNDGMNKDELSANLAKEAIVTKRMTPQEFTAFVQGELDKWSPVVKALGSTR